MPLKINSQHNRLTILENIKKYGNSYAVCRCECGTVKEIKEYHIKTGAIKSCGCFNRDVGRSRKGQVSPLLKPEGYAAKYRLFKRYQNDARRRSTTFELTLEQFLNLTRGNCYYCGKSPQQIAKARLSRSFYVYNGVDRVDNFLGYSKSNCVSCCKQCNTAKAMVSKKEFFAWIETIYEKHIEEALK